MAAFPTLLTVVDCCDFLSFRLQGARDQIKLQQKLCGQHQKFFIPDKVQLHYEENLNFTGK